MDTLENKIAKINEKFDKKQSEMLAKLAEERAFAIAQETVNDAVERMPSMSVGNIITIFENISPDIVKTRGGKERINKFVSMVKEDSNLKSLYALKENIVPSVFVSDPKEFINESISIAKEMSDERSFKTSKNNLVRFVSEAIRSISPEKAANRLNIDESVRRINDNVEMLMWGERKIGNAAARTNSVNETINFITKKQNNTENKEDVFEHYKTECINSLTEAWEAADVNVRMKLTEMKERISKKMYSELTADDDIKYMKELIDTVK